MARVNATGRVTGIDAGSATITATIEGKTGWGRRPKPSGFFMGR